MALHLGSTGRVVSVQRPTAHYELDEIFGTAHGSGGGPQVYLVRQSPHGVTRPHYHEVDQYQVFTSGAGTIGRKTVRPTTVHYADAHTSYGPIVSGGDGVDYFTARFRADSGTYYMPESRGKKRKSGRHYTIAIDSDAAGVSGDLVTLIEPHADGLAAYLVRVAAGGRLTLPRLSGSGRLVTVMAGSLADPSGVEHGEWTWSYLDSPGEANPCRAGGAGAMVLCLDYPHERGRCQA